ncbi:helix-turn-helix domain-containing protein [Paraliobacillus salinarum]|uniref:helix-turn-helix domain-containing protein n=1 Tax=Paraliobacillus salinarum TaxID=1158996 RepID=UPI0015F5775C|nr:helix-turn-helix transcriptional regulator [Paraliobacillus salinarum]
MEQSNVKITIKLKELLNQRGITQQEFAEMSGLRTATISEIANNQRTSINKKHLETIIQTLDLSSMDELLSIEKSK